MQLLALPRQACRCHGARQRAASSGSGRHDRQASFSLAADQLARNRDCSNGPQSATFPTAGCTRQRSPNAVATGKYEDERDSAGRAVAFARLRTTLHTLDNRRTLAGGCAACLRGLLAGFGWKCSQSSTTAGTDRQFHRHRSCVRWGRSPQRFAACSKVNRPGLGVNGRSPPGAGLALH